MRSFISELLAFSLRLPWWRYPRELLLWQRLAARFKLSPRHTYLMGYADRDKIIEGALIASLSDEHVDYYSMERLNLLANLIADGILDIRIAYTEDAKGIGMYHEKMGIIADVEGNKVAFSGSMNESATAMLVNYETIDVFRSWGDESEQERVTLKQNAFYSIWNDTEPNIHVLEFPNVTEALIEKYRRKAPDYGIDHQQYVGLRRRESRRISDSTIIRNKRLLLGSEKTIAAYMTWRPEQAKPLPGWDQSQKSLRIWTTNSL